MDQRDLQMRGRLLGACLIGIFVAAACGAPATPLSSSTASSTATSVASGSPAATGQSLVLGFSLSPVGGCDGTTIVTITGSGNCPQLVEEALVRFDETSKTVQPALAESWTFDGLSATFKLRPNVKFQDGTPFNADAVVYNYRRVWDPTFAAHQGLKFPYAANVPIKSVEKIDDMTVRVNFTVDRYDTMLWMTSFAAMIQSPTAVEKLGADYSFNAVGTGPYRIVSYTDGARIELERWDGYWGAKPAAAKVVFVFKDSAAIVNDLLSGAIDGTISPSIEQIDQIKGAGLEVQASPGLVIYGAWFNSTKPPFDDLQVRQAAEYAIDKESIAGLSKGAAKPMYGAWIDGQAAYNAGVPAYKFDPKMAAQLLDQAGWVLAPGGTVRQKNGQPLQITLIGRTGYSGMQALYPPVLVSNLQDVGFEVKTATVDQAVQYTASGYLDLTKWNLALGGWGAVVPDAGSMLSHWTSAELPPAGLNVGRFTDPAYDKLVADAAVAIDTTAHDQLLEQAQLVLRNDAAYLWVYQNQSMAAFNPAKITSFPFRITGQPDILNFQLK